MTQLSASDLETIRTRPQRTDLSLSIFSPQAIFKARINDASIAKGARTITYNTVSLGSYTSIEANFTMWVGTTDGGKELGKIRVRSATSSQIVVSENSDVNWQNAAYLTVFKYVELWPIFPRIIQDPSNQENTIWYKDYDIAYTNQNSILGTYICMGPNRAGMVDPASNTLQFYYTATGTTNLLGSSLNYQWTFEGGSPASSTALTPGYVTYNTPGNYITRLSVSGSNGAIDTSYRTVRVHSPVDPPVQKWQLQSLSGSRDEGGYTATFKVFETIPIQEFAVVVLYADNWYGATHQSFGGNAQNASNIFWVGYIEKDSINYDYEHSEVTFTASSLTMIMKKTAGFAISVGSVANPAYWYELLDMDSRRALYHYLRWHTTALSISDFQFVGTDYPSQFFDSERESIYDAIDNRMRTALNGKVVSDRQGKVWMEVNAESYSNPTGSFPATMSITKRDWMGEPAIEERLTNEVSFIEVGGVAYSGVATGTFAAFLCGVPGNAPGFRGTDESPIEGLTLASQEQLNQLAGNIFANRNTPFPTATFDLANNFSNIDIAPQESAQVTINGTDTIRSLAVNGLYLPNDMSWTHDPKNKIIFPKVSYQQLVTGIAGETITIPPVEDQGAGFNVPGLQIPPLTPLTIPSLSTGTIQAIVDSAVQNALQDYGTYTYQFFTGGVTSSFRGASLDSASIDSSGAGYIKFTVATSGIYYVSGHLDVNGPPDSIAIILDHSALSGDVRFTMFSNAGVPVGQNGTIAQVFNLTGGGWVSFTWSSSGAFSQINFASLNIVRISA